MLPTRLSEVGPLPLERIASITLALAKQLDVLHAADTVHGHIRPSRVTLTDTAVELDPPDGVGFSKPHDVRSLAELALWLLSRSDLPATGAFAQVARAAAALDPSERPTAEQLIQQLENVAASPGAPRVSVATRRPVRPLKAVVAAAVVLGATALATVAWAQTRRVPPPARDEPSVTTTHTVPRRTAALPAQVWPEARSVCAGVASSLVGDLDGDGCDEEVRFDNGRFVANAGAVAITGASATHHATGDWHCDGRSTLAMLDPASGAVFVFPRWARRGEAVPAIEVAQVGGAVSLAAGDVDGDGCDDLRVVTDTGDLLEVDLTPSTQP